MKILKVIEEREKELVAQYLACADRCGELRNLIHEEQDDAAIETFLNSLVEYATAAKQAHDRIKEIRVILRAISKLADPATYEPDGPETNKKS